MPQEINQEGIFRGNIVQYALDRFTTGSTAVFLKVRIEEILSDGEWFDWKEHEFEALGKIFVIGKEGQLLEKACKSLIENAGWDGDLTAISENQWSPTPVQIVVGSEEYEGETRYKIKFVNSYDRMPGNGSVSSDDAAALQAKFGSQLRAMAGGKGKPEAKKAPPKASPPKAAPPQAAASGSDDIPF